jgi:hypothetical protein
MEKVVLKSGNTPETVLVQFNKQNIEVTPYISEDLAKSLIPLYIGCYFNSIGLSDGEWNKSIVSLSGTDYFNAERLLKYGLLSSLLNVDISKLSYDEVFNYEGCLWNKVVIEIKNYYDFRETLDNMVSDIKKSLEMKLSVGQVVDNAVGQVINLINSFKDMDPTKFQEVGSNLIKQLENSSVSSAFKEAAIEKKTKKVNSKKTRVVDEDESVK